jgi:predicted aminopeptidase
VPYKGFFSRRAADAERAKLAAKGYDTYLRPTTAFSTLGWFPDPLLSTVLASQDSVGLVETVIHEVTHNTLFVPDHVTFNESFANFVGSVGAIAFFCRPGHADRACETARARWHDSVAFGRFLDSLWDALDALYAESLPRTQVLDRRATLLNEMAERYRADYVPKMQTPGYARFDPDRLNNASLIARHLYYHRLDLFDALYERDGELVRIVRRVAGAVKGADDPWEAVESLAGAGAAADPRPPTNGDAP